MSWNADKEPIPYLKQRVRYYKKKMGSIRKLENDQHLILKYGEEILGDMVGIAELRAKEQYLNFSRAVEILENNERSK